MPKDGEKVTVMVPVSGLSDDSKAKALEALQRECERHGLVPGAIRLVSAGPWTEPFEGIGPYEDVYLHFYEASAHRHFLPNGE